MSELLSWRGRPVPWVVKWSAENRGDPVLMTPGGLVYPGGELPGDRAFGFLWCRYGLGRHGAPLFAELHTGRQRAAMLRSRCHICGESAASGGRVDWLLTIGDLRDDDGQAKPYVSTPPCCRGCQEIAMLYCPALRRDGAVSVTVASAVPSGVLGNVYDVRSREMTRPLPVGLDDTKAAPQVLGKQLLVRFVDVRVRDVWPAQRCGDGESGGRRFAAARL